MRALHLKNENGQSLVQVLVSAAIMSIILMSLISVQTIDSSNLVNSGSLPINNAVNITPTNPYTINLRHIGNNTGGKYIASITDPQASLMSNTLQVLPAGGIQLVLTSPTSATLRVNFVQSKLVRSITNLSFPIALNTNLPTNPTTISIVGCQAASNISIANCAANDNSSVGCTSGKVMGCRVSPTFMCPDGPIAASYFATCRAFSWNGSVWVCNYPQVGGWCEIPCLSDVVMAQ